MARTTTFAAVHFATAFGVAWLITGSPLAGGAVALIEPAINTVAFYVHERLWGHFSEQPENGRSGVDLAA